MVVETKISVDRTEDGDIRISIFRDDKESKNRSSTTFWLDDEKAGELSNALGRVLE